MRINRFRVWPTSWGAAFALVESCKLLDDWFGSNAFCSLPQDREGGSGLAMIDSVAVKHSR
jgi:hypothetical protein